MTRTKIELRDIGPGQALLISGGHLTEHAVEALERFIEGEGKLAIIELMTNTADLQLWVIERLPEGRIRIVSQPAPEPEAVQVVERGPVDRPVVTRSAKEFAATLVAAQKYARDSGAKPDPNDIPPGWGRAKARAQVVATDLLETPMVQIGDGFLVLNPLHGAPIVMTLSSARRFALELDRMMNELEHHLAREGYEVEDATEE